MKYSAFFPHSFAASTVALAFLSPLGAATLTFEEKAVADSVADWIGNAGGVPVGPDANGWSYGYYDLTNDGDGTYQPGDFTEFTGTRAGGFGLAPSGAPWTTVSDAQVGHPNGTNSAPNAEHWAIRRYTSAVSGEHHLNYFLNASNTNGTGTTAIVYVNGVEVARTTQSTAAGGSGTANVNVNVGDIIDVALTPEGTDGSRVDGSDASNFGISLNPFATYETIGTIADSVADFGGVQGLNGWSYGYYDITALGGAPSSAGDFTAFPNDGGAHSDTNFWNGSAWVWFNGNQPWTSISAAGGHPNGSNQPNQHWATRRYEVQPGEAGDLLVEWNLSADNLNGTGTSIHVLLNGVEVDFEAIAGNDGTGIVRAIQLNGVQVGDVIDIALSPEGITGDTADGADGSFFGAKIHQLQPVPEPAVPLFIGFAGLTMLLRRRRSRP